MSPITSWRPARTAAVLATTAALLLAGMAAVEAASTDLPLTVTNTSGRSEQTYVYIMARSQTTGAQGYVDAGGTWHAFSLPASVESGSANPQAPDVSIAGPANGSSTTLPVPANLSGGRIYVSFGTKLSFQLSPGGLVEPAAWNPGDPNHEILFDWAEFARNGTAININTTMVDMFSVPIAITVTGPDGTTRTEGALTEGGREEIFDDISALGGDWAELVDVRESDGLPLRVLAPIHGIDSASPVFSPTFFDTYVSDVYSYYANHPLTVDTALGAFTGTVSGDGFTFADTKGTVIGTLPRPTTSEVFGCSGAIQPSNQPNQTAILAVGARVCAGFHRGTLSTAGRAGSDRQATYDATAFYQQPASDLYAKVMHDASTNGRAYGFAFDDVAEFNPSIDEPAPVSATMTLAPFTSTDSGSVGGDDDEGSGFGSGSGGSNADGDATDDATVEATGAVSSAIEGKCLDVKAANSDDGTPVQLYDCNGTTAQTWTTYSDDTLRALGKCLESVDGGTIRGTRLQIATCTAGATNQQWRAHDGGYQNPTLGLCVDDPSSSTNNGARVRLWTCNATVAQLWSQPGGVVADGATDTGGTGGLAATATIQAESSNAQAGTVTEATTDGDGGQDVGGIGDGDWLTFDDVDFGSTGLSTLSARVASGANPGVSGIVEIRLDSRTSTPVGSFAVGSTGGWQTWKTIPAGISTTTGTHTVHLTFATGSGQEFINVNWLTFS